MQNIFAMDGPLARVMNLVWDLLILSLLWFLCSIPIITMGASSTAAYYTAAKVLRHHNGRLISEFFRSFRVNFKQSAVFSLFYILVFLVLVLDCTYFYGTRTQSGVLMLYLFYLMILMTAGSMLYVFPLLSRFHVGFFALLRTAVFRMFRHLPTTILLLLLLIAVVLGIYLMPWGILVFPGVLAYAQTFLMERILRACAPTPQEGSEEAKKWYYQ